MAMLARMACSAIRPALSTVSERAPRNCSTRPEATAGDDRAVERELLAGRPATEIVECAAERDTDQIVMGSHGRDGAARLLLGSVSETVVRRSPVPVTVVR